MLRMRDPPIGSFLANRHLLVHCLVVGVPHGFATGPPHLATWLASQLASPAPSEARSLRSTDLIRWFVPHHLIRLWRSFGVFHIPFSIRSSYFIPYSTPLIHMLNGCLWRSHATEAKLRADSMESLVLSSFD